MVLEMGIIGWIVVGFLAGAICFLALSIKRRFRFDDALDVIAVHLVGGLFGSIVLGLFATAGVNAAVVDEGLFFGGGGSLLWYQTVAAVATFAFSFAVSFVLAKVIDATIGLRVPEGDEDEGLAVQRGEREQRVAQLGIGDAIRGVGARDRWLKAKQRAQGSRAALAAPSVGEHAARDADQPAELSSTRQVCLPAPGDRVGLRNRVVGVVRRRHRSRIGEHPRVGRVEEGFKVHTGQVSARSSIATAKARSRER